MIKKKEKTKKPFNMMMIIVVKIKTLVKKHVCICPAHLTLMSLVNNTAVQGKK